MATNSKGKRKKILIGVTAAVLLLFAVGYAAFRAYVSDYYRADETAEEALEGSADVSVQEEDDRIIFEPQGEWKDGLVFYPGGLVEYSAYAPLMEEYAEHGIFTVLVKMPYNLAVFDQNKADDVIGEYDVKNWYIGGHSLGGVMASAYAAEHADELRGIVLLGSYSTKDLKDTDLKAVSLYGSEDQVLKKEGYEKNRDNLPEDTVEEVLIGGNHSQFGSYGHQEGDGTASISSETQWKETVDYSMYIMEQ